MEKPRYRIKVDRYGRVWYQYTQAWDGKKMWWSPFTEEERYRLANPNFKTVKFINIGQ